MASKFEKSRSNRGVENHGLLLLLTDRRFQAADLPTRRRILELLPVKGEFGIRTFDAVMTPEPVEAITAENVEHYFDDLRLVEMKTTRDTIPDASLRGFFFGATEREYTMARALGDKYLFAFVVLNELNVYGRPFAVLLTLDEVEAKTASRRVQYQVNFRTTMDPPDEAVQLIVLGDTVHLPVLPPDATSSADDLGQLSDGVDLLPPDQR
jgi:hypothetical protein